MSDKLPWIAALWFAAAVIVGAGLARWFHLMKKADERDAWERSGERNGNYPDL